MTDTNAEVAPESLPLPLVAMVESLLFVSSEPAPVGHIAEALDVSIEQVEEALAELREASTNGIPRGLRIQRKGDKVQLTTRPECAPYVEKFLGLAVSGRLSKPALETLAIVAYQQPITRPEIEMIRGVNCDGVIQTLLSKGLIEEVGRLETAGRPIQYGTTFAFLQHFGLRSLDELPSLKFEEPAAPQETPEETSPTAEVGAFEMPVRPTIDTPPDTTSAEPPPTAGEGRPPRAPPPTAGEGRPSSELAGVPIELPFGASPDISTASPLDGPDDPVQDASVDPQPEAV